MDDKKRSEIVNMALNLRNDEYLLVRDYLDPETVFLADSAIDMYSSLLKAVDDAGGSGFSVDSLDPSMTLKKMSVLELISHLCTNKIRFIYDPYFHSNESQ
jgi:hypothetical protein